MKIKSHTEIVNYLDSKIESFNKFLKSNKKLIEKAKRNSYSWKNESPFNELERVSCSFESKKNVLEEFKLWLEYGELENE